MSDSFSLIVDRLTTQLGVDQAAVQPGVTFADLDLDSLTMTELAVSIEDALRIRLPFIEPASTIAEAAEQLDGTLAAASTGQVTR